MLALYLSIIFVLLAWYLGSSITYIIRIGKGNAGDTIFWVDVAVFAFFVWTGVLLFNALNIKITMG
jgi:hypothetical protein